MRNALSPLRWFGAIKREWLLYHLAEPAFAFMYDPPPPNEWVALDCETTGLDVRHDEIISVGAVRIVGQTVMTSERLELLIKPERDVSAQSVRVHRLRQRDLMEGISSLYYDDKFKRLPPWAQQGNPDIDLRFATIMADLNLPTREAHDALNDAVMTAMAFIKLRQLKATD